MSRLNIEVSPQVLRASSERLAVKLRNRAAMIDSVAHLDSFEVLDWEELRADLDNEFDNLFAALGIVEEIELSDDGLIDADEYDEPDYYDDEVA